MLLTGPQGILQHDHTQPTSRLCDLCNPDRIHRYLPAGTVIGGVHEEPTGESGDAVIMIPGCYTSWHPIASTHRG